MDEIWGPFLIPPPGGPNKGSEEFEKKKLKFGVMVVQLGIGFSCSGV